MAGYEIAGVPRALIRDGWWFDAPQAGGPVAAGPQVRRGSARAGWLLLALIVLADGLFWRQAGPGLSLALFLLAVAAAVRSGAGAVSRRDWAAMIVLLAVLPLVERVQALSVAFAVLGVAGYAVWLHEGTVRGMWARLPALIRLLPSGPVAGWRGLGALRHRAGGDTGRWARALALPLGLGLCFSALLLAANPVLSDWAGEVFDIGFDPARVLFWAGVAVLLWPLLALQDAPSLPEVAVSLPQWRFGGVVNAGSVMTSLMLFNLMFAVQTALDMAYLWGDAALPAGMSHAAYAHRGAYPLVATALLAGVFALVARAYAAESRVVRGLLLLWIGQNVLLVISALYRLQAYVAAYGLTYLRVYAAIWMGLVAVGLALVAWQVLRGRENGWLSLRCAALGAGVLYACCFVNFAGVIAGYNLTAWHEGRLVTKLDRPYLCMLGPDAWAAIQRHHAGWNCDAVFNRDWDYEVSSLDLVPPRIEGWRDWSFRSWRVLREAELANSDRG